MFDTGVPFGKDDIREISFRWMPFTSPFALFGSWEGLGSGKKSSQPSLSNLTMLYGVDVNLAFMRIEFFLGCFLEF
jgi:hypothetical protein